MRAAWDTRIVAMPRSYSIYFFLKADVRIGQCLTSASWYNLLSPCQTWKQGSNSIACMGRYSLAKTRDWGDGSSVMYFYNNSSRLVVTTEMRKPIYHNQVSRNEEGEPGIRRLQSTDKALEKVAQLSPIWFLSRHFHFSVFSRSSQNSLSLSLYRSPYFLRSFDF